MKFSTFLILRTLLPFFVILCLLGSIILFNVYVEGIGRWLAYTPAFIGFVTLTTFYYRTGFCPKCGHQIPKKVGKSCGNCGHVWQKEDIVSHQKKHQSD